MILAEGTALHRMLHLPEQKRDDLTASSPPSFKVDIPDLT